MIKKSP